MQAAMTAANTTCGTTAEATTTEAAITHAELDLWRPVILATTLLTGIPAATATFLLRIHGCGML